MTNTVRRPYGTGAIFQRKDGRWIGRIEAGWDGNNERRRIEVSAKTEGECKRKLVAKRRDIEANGLPTGDVSERATVRSWTDTWLPQIKKQVRSGVHSDYTSVVRKWIVPVLGNKKLVNLNPGDLRNLERAQINAGLKPSSALKTHRVLMKCLNDALVEGHRIPARIFAAKGPVASQSDRDAIPTADAVALLQAAVALPDRSRWLAGLLQGMRQGEVLGLTWDHVDLEKGLIDVQWQLDSIPYLDRANGTFDIPAHIPHRHIWKSFHLVPVKTKSGRRLIPLVGMMRLALEEWAGQCPDSPHGLVWPRESGLPRNELADAEAFRHLQDLAQVASFDGQQGRRYDGHEMRHTTATLLLEAGVDPEVIKAILGHSSIVTSRGYMHVDQKLARQAIESIAERLSLPA